MLREDVLRRQKDFDRIYKYGKSTGSRYTILFYLKNDKGFNRTAFLASKKVGNSVKRNRARRLLREAYRTLKPEIKLGYDFVIVSRNSINDKKEKDVYNSLRDNLIKAKVI